MPKLNHHRKTVKHSRIFYKNWETFSREKFGLKDENFSIKFNSEKEQKLFSNGQNHRKTPLFSRVLACFCSTWNGKPKSNCSTWNIVEFKCLSAFALRYCVFYYLFNRIVFSLDLRVGYCWFLIPFSLFYCMLLTYPYKPFFNGLCYQIATSNRI